MSLIELRRGDITTRRPKPVVTSLRNRRFEASCDRRDSRVGRKRGRVRQRVRSRNLRFDAPATDTAFLGRIWAASAGTAGPASPESPANPHHDLTALPANSGKGLNGKEGSRVSGATTELASVAATTVRDVAPRREVKLPSSTALDHGCSPASRSPSREYRRDVSAVAAARATTPACPTIKVARRARVIAV